MTDQTQITSPAQIRGTQADALVDLAELLRDIIVEHLPGDVAPLAVRCEQIRSRLAQAAADRAEWIAAR